MFSSNTSQVSNAATYIEDVFSTWLYTGNGSTQTITNGIDLAGKGGMTWIKQRSATRDNLLFDTTRGATQRLFSNLTLAQSQDTQSLTAFNADGFSIGSDSGCNINGGTYASWTFRKQPKFFDVVTYTGDGTANRNVAHSLAAAPGFVIIKRTSGSSNWCVAARLNSGDASFMMLNRTVAQTSTSASWFNSTTFKVGTSDWPSSTGSPDFFGYDTNSTGETYVAYLFAHNAGGFGLTGTDNVISCGSFTADASGNATVNLGYEPQWILYKQTTGTAGWNLLDTMRGMSYASNAYLTPNSSGAESVAAGNYLTPTATGFQGNNGAFANSTPYIYIAIRRGPMKTPTSGTSVFAPVTYTGTGSNTKQVVTTFPPDMVWPKNRSGSDSFAWTRLQGLFGLSMSDTSAQASLTNRLTSWNQNGVTLGISQPNNSGDPYVLEGFQRAPNFFDVVCYTGTGTTTTQNHNLGVAPELIIVKCRSAVTFWYVYSATYGRDYYAFLNDTIGFQSDPGNSWGTTNPTSTTFSLSPLTETNASGSTYVAYLFASCPGVSKVGSYTGTGGTQTINCGFAARFVLIKRGNGTGNWWFWDTAQGMVANTDPRMALNSTSGQSNADWVFTNASGFQIVTTDATVNASGGSYIYLAIA